jgi:hypothetical protein
MVVVMIKYVTNSFFLPIHWKILLIIVTGAICLVGVVIGIFSDGVGPFVGFSISYFAVVGFITLYGASIFAKDYRKRDIAPIFFSPWVFPIYKYHLKSEKIKKHNIVGVIMFGVILLVLVWSILCTVWLSPHFIGIAIGSLCEVLITLFSIYIAGISPLQLGFAVKNTADKQKAVKKAWLQAKQTYLKDKGSTYPDDFANFKDRVTKRRHITLMIAEKRKGNKLAIEDMETNKAW